MDDDDRAKLFFEIAKCRNQPGIVREWVDVELERRHALELGSVEWVERKNLEWEAKYVLDRKFEAESQAEREAQAKKWEHLKRTWAISREEGIRRAKLQRQKQEAAQREERKRCEQILGDFSDRISPRELAQVRRLERGRKNPRKPRAIYLSVVRMRSLKLAMPRETLWSMEMSEHTRMAYLPFKICDREFSEMDPILRVNDETPEELEEEFPEDDRVPEVDREW